jgi:cytochrome P450
MATWFILCIIQSPERLARYRKICQEVLLPQEGNHADDLRFDMAKLRADPFVQGLWKEALRLGSASAAARVATKDVEVEGYTLRKGSVVLMPVRLMHFNTDIFPAPERFDPERWIVDLPADASKEETAAALQKQKKQNASLRSFGGGVGLCSGRYVAEQEILSTVSTVLLLFDIELEKDQGSFELNPRSLGIMSPAKELDIKIRKRDARGLV